MKNIQIIDGAENCVYEIFAATDEEFSIIFPATQDIAFIEEVYEREAKELMNTVFSQIWTRSVNKPTVAGIHGTLFYGLQSKSQFYPTRIDKESI